MTTKTINLTGAEVAVTGLDGANAHIRNDGTEVIYAAKTAGITAGADGVASIPAGQDFTLCGISGTVHLLGTGSVQLVSNDYVPSPFGDSTASGGSAVDEQARTALGAHVGNAEIHVTAAEKENWNNKAELSDIPTTLPDEVARAAVSAHENDTTAHIPSGGTLGQILGTNDSGAATWQTHKGIDIGRNTAGETYTVDGVEYTGSTTCEIFNFDSNKAGGLYSHAEGCLTAAIGECSHAEGLNTIASGNYSHAEGSGAKAIDECSHAEGLGTIASGFCSHAEGGSAESSGENSHAEGLDTIASGNYSHAEGSGAKAIGENSHAEGLDTTASNFASHAGGKFNKAMSNGATYSSNVGDVFVIGNGTSSSTLGNAFRVTYGGAVYGLSAFNSSGADYAEFIKPWADGNPDNEDRVGYMVTVKDGLLCKANDGDYIVGITSGNPSVVGNADEDYYWRYERDEFNRFVYEDAEEEVEQLDDDGAPVLDENGMPVMEKTGNIIKNAHYKLAADYDPTKQNDYIERKNRPEWSYVGMIGVIPVRDDGTCEAGCFCKCGQNGIATRAESRGFDTFFVIERISDNVVSVEIR